MQDDRSGNGVEYALIQLASTTEEFSKPIIAYSGIIFLKVNYKKKIDVKIDKKKEMERLLSFERDRILNEYSIIYYKEIENKAYVEKF